MAFKGQCIVRSDVSTELMKANRLLSQKHLCCIEGYFFELPRLIVAIDLRLELVLMQPGSVMALLQRRPEGAQQLFPGGGEDDDSDALERNNLHVAP